MDSKCLNYRLTDDERNQFEENGYFVVKNALPTDLVESLLDATDRIYENYGPHSGVAYQQGKIQGSENGRLNMLDAISRDERFLDLLDWPQTFPKVVDILGWNIQLYHSHLIITPPLDENDPQNIRRLGWHQDSGRLNKDIETSPKPRISLKVGFFLTSTNSPERGCFHVIPGKHLEDNLELSSDHNVEHADSTPVLADAGDAVFFDRRIWHAGGKNTSNITRKVLFLGYSYRWLKPRDDMDVQHYMHKADPIRQQLLGSCTTGGYGFTSPEDVDVPLKLWWSQHAG